MICAKYTRQSRHGNSCVITPIHIQGESATRPDSKNAVASGSQITDYMDLDELNLTFILI